MSYNKTSTQEILNLIGVRNPKSRYRNYWEMFWSYNPFRSKNWNQGRINHYIFRGYDYKYYTCMLHVNDHDKRIQALGKCRKYFKTYDPEYQSPLYKVVHKRWGDYIEEEYPPEYV